MALSIVNTSPLPNGTWPSAYSQTFRATGGVLPYAWSITGTPPPGLTINSSSGVLSGAPLVSATVSFTVMVVDAAAATDSKSFSLTIAGLPVPQAGVPYSADFTQAYAEAVMAYYQPFTGIRPPYSFFNRIQAFGSWGTGALLDGWSGVPWLSMTQCPGPEPGCIGGHLSGTPPTPLGSFSIGLGVIIVDAINEGHAFSGVIDFVVLSSGSPQFGNRSYPV